MSIRLLNPRGRLVILDDSEQGKLSDLLSRGFSYLPDDQPDMTYSQVHDKGQEFVEERRPRQRIVKVEQVRDSLNTERI